MGAARDESISVCISDYTLQDIPPSENNYKVKCYIADTLKQAGIPVMPSFDFNDIKISHGKIQSFSDDILHTITFKWKPF